MAGLGQTYFATLVEDDVLETERGAETRRARADDAHIDVLRDQLNARRVKRCSPPRHCDVEGTSSEFYLAQRDTAVALQCHVTLPTWLLCGARGVPGR